MIKNLNLILQLVPLCAFSKPVLLYVYFFMF